MKKKKKRKNLYCFKMIIIILVCIIFLLFDRTNNNHKIKNMLNDSYTYIFNNIKKDNNLSSNISETINKDYEKEIESLKEQLKINQTLSDKKLINASIIKRNPSYWYNTITINKGSKNDIKKGNAVINEKGLIGIITSVSNNSSTVKLIIDNNSNNYISAYFTIEDKAFYGLINKYSIQKNELYLNKVVGDFNNIKLDNITVQTSGLTDTISSGLLIGKIKSIKKDKYGISNTLIITPSVDFNDIRNVVVIIGDKDEK